MVGNDDFGRIVAELDRDARGRVRYEDLCQHLDVRPLRPPAFLAERQARAEAAARGDPPPPPPSWEPRPPWESPGSVDIVDRPRSVGGLASLPRGRVEPPWSARVPRGSCNPNDLVDPQFNPRQSYREPPRGRRAVTPSPRMGRGTDGLAGDPGHVALEEARQSGLRLRGWAWAARPDDAPGYPEDLRRARVQQSHTPLFHADLPFGREGATEVGVVRRGRQRRRHRLQEGQRARSASQSSSRSGWLIGSPKILHPTGSPPPAQAPSRESGGVRVLRLREGPPTPGQTSK